MKLTDDEIVEGTTYTTWTYLTVDTEIVRQRLNSEAELPRGGRCGFDIVVADDTLRMFPTRTFRMLLRFDVRVDRISNQVTLVQSGNVIGRYPKTPAPASVVKFRITMSVNQGAGDLPVQLIDLWLQRGIGPVVREIGVFPAQRARARLRSAFVNGVSYPQGNTPAFDYFDE